MKCKKCGGEIENGVCIKCETFYGFDEDYNDEIDKNSSTDENSAINIGYTKSEHPISNNKTRKNSGVLRVIIILIIAIAIAAPATIIGIIKRAEYNDVLSEMDNAISSIKDGSWTGITENTTEKTTEKPNSEQSKTTQKETTTKAETTTKEETTKKVAETTTKAKSNNEIPEQYRASVEQFKSSSDKDISYNNLYITVGDKKSPSQGQVWPNRIIYSGDISIAKVSDNAIIEGVSAGETYVVIASDEGSTVYNILRVVVSPVATPPAEGKNEIPVKYLNEVENFKNREESYINLMTIEVAVGDKKVPNQTWPNGIIYSGNTSIAKISNRTMIEGVSVGETYVVTAASEESNVYFVLKVIVS